jgi:hypothetical protein
VKRFWCEFRRDWDLVLVLLVLCAIATCAQAATVTLQYAATGTAPHVELNAATVNGKINVRVAPCAVPGVKFYLDNVFKNVEGGCPYDYGGDNFLIDTKALAEGAHTIEAREGNGVTVRATATFTVQNAAPPPPPPLPTLRVTMTTTPPQLFGQAGAPLTISWVANDASATCLTDFPGAPAGNPGSVTFAFPAPVITSIAYRIGCTRSSDGQRATYLLTVQSEPPRLPPFVTPVPGCYPTEPGCAFAESTDGHVKVWVVDAADSVILYRTSYNPGAYPACVDSFTLTHANADRQWGRCKVSFNAADAAIGDALDAKFSPHFTAVGGPVFYVNVDGTLGLALVREGAPLTVAPGEPCLMGRKIVNGGKRYQLVHPAPDANGNRLPGNSFAECVRQDAPVGGWP